MKKKTIKNLDCVELKNKIQFKIYKEIEGLGVSDQIAYFQDGALAGPLGDLWTRINQKKSKSNKHKIIQL